MASSNMALTAAFSSGPRLDRSGNGSDRTGVPPFMAKAVNET
jgi:hypothetical protein